MLRGLRFAQMLLEGGTLNATRLLGRKSVEALTADQMTPGIQNRVAVPDPNGAGYGFGVTVALRATVGVGAGLIGSPGDFYWNGAYGTLWWAGPKKRLARFHDGATSAANYRPPSQRPNGHGLTARFMLGSRPVA